MASFKGIGGVSAAVLAFAAALTASEPANAQDQLAAAPTGKLVTLSLGPGFDRASALLVKGAIEAEGCPTTLNNDGLFDGAMDVAIGNFEHEDTFDTSGAAGAYALELCKSS